MMVGKAWRRINPALVTVPSRHVNTPLPQGARKNHRTRADDVMKTEKIFVEQMFTLGSDLAASARN
jgi:hypothetical protein